MNYAELSSAVNLYIFFSIQFRFVFVRFYIFVRSFSFQIQTVFFSLSWCCFLLKYKNGFGGKGIYWGLLGWHPGTFLQASNGALPPARSVAWTNVYSINLWSSRRVWMYQHRSDNFPLFLFSKMLSLKVVVAPRSIFSQLYTTACPNFLVLQNDFPLQSEKKWLFIPRLVLFLMSGFRFFLFVLHWILIRSDCGLCTFRWLTISTVLDDCSSAYPFGKKCAPVAADPHLGIFGVHLILVPITPPSVFVLFVYFSTMYTFAPVLCFCLDGPKRLISQVINPPNEAYHGLIYSTEYLSVFDTVRDPQLGHRPRRLLREEFVKTEKNIFKKFQTICKSCTNFEFRLILSAYLCISFITNI